jgi:YfiH family protein
MFFSSKLKKNLNIKHCFFSRKNGFSKGLYGSLNCGMGSHDKKENIVKNLKFVSEKINCNENFLITLNQEHSNKVIHFKNKDSVKNKLKGDAIVTQVKNIGIGILAADCAPILFYDPKKKIIGCAHAGWKGALNGIIKNTIKKFYELDSNCDDLIVAVGPCIGKNNYEVKTNFIKKFLKKDTKNDVFFKKKNETHYNFDLRGYINNEIVKLNIKNIENIDKDTFAEKELFFSYRRSCLNKERDYGRFISVILMT